jgi:hypothetical protein
VCASTGTKLLYVKVGTAATAWAPLSFTPSTVSPSAAWFGDGFDGAQTFNGTSGVLGITPVSNVYTLTRDIFLSDGSVASGVTIATSGYRVFVAGTLTNNGTISHSGSDAVGANGGTGTTIGGGNGRSGSAGNGSPGSNSGFSIGLPHWTSSSGLGGKGGDAGNTGGAGGTVAASAYQGLTIVGAMTARIENGFGLPFSSGSGGGGGALGAGALAGDFGGGGGAGGGWCVVAARKLLGTGTIAGNGGNGANGSSSGAAFGGGGGGGGGVVVVVYMTNPGSNTFSAAGGLGAGTAPNKGTAGNPGSRITLNLSGDGT